jgi:hypothetical protein
VFVAPELRVFSGRVQARIADHLPAIYLAVEKGRMKLEEALL